MTSLLYYGCLIFCFAATFIFFRAVFFSQTEEELFHALDIAPPTKVSASPLFRLSRVFVIRLMPLTTRIQAVEWRRKRQRDLLTGGLREEITLDELWAYKFWLAGVALIMVALINCEASLWIWGAAGVVGFFFPDQWVKDRVKKRSHDIARALPQVADMLALSVEAGLDFVAAVGKVVNRSEGNALVDELGVMLNEMRMGASRADALRSLAGRCNLPELSSFVSVLVQADQMGVSISQVLRAQSDRLRTERFQKAERQGALATQKILFPLVVCIMPAVFIVFFGPLILKYAFSF